MTTEDRKTVEELVQEWEPSTHPVMKGVADLLTAGEFESILSYLRGHARRYVTWAILATKTTSVARDLGLDLRGIAATSPTESAYSLFISVEANSTADDPSYNEMTKELPDVSDVGSAPSTLDANIYDAVIERFFPKDAERIAERVALYAGNERMVP